MSTGLGSLALAFAFAANPAFAQAPGSQENPVSAVPTGDANASTTNADDGVIVVTGSRIARRDLESAAPLAVVSSEEFKLTGAVNVENVINALPQVIPGTTAFSNNPGGGVSTLNLRNLLPQRTLVLVNGRRYMFFDTAQTVDLNTIPQFLIDGVDVVTGGASAVYGSDAVAGVVNFRLRQNVQGFEVGSQYQITEEGDGRRWETHVAMGTEFADGRGHITAFAEYYKRNAIYGGARDFSRVAQADNTAHTALQFGGNATVPQGRIVVPATQAIAAGNGLPGVTLNRGAGTNYGSSLGAFFGTAGTSTPYAGNAIDGYNIGPANLLMVPQERWLTGAYGEYELNDKLTAYMEVQFANNRVANQLAATPVTGSFNVPIAAVSKYLSAADVAQLRQIDANETAIAAAQAARGITSTLPGAGTVQLSINRRVLETGGRIQNDERNAFRALAGFKGEVVEGWNYDAYYSYARTRNSQVQYGNISRSGFTSALAAGNLNIFGPNTITADQLSAISITAQNQDISELQVAQASINGSLFNFGLGGDDVGVAFGGEWRKVRSEFIPDTALSSGDVIGFNAGDPTEGGYSVKEVFGELRIPIAANQPFFQRLEATAAGRYSDYSLGAVGGVWTYAGGLEWAPIKDITFRGQYQRAIRAPNVGELFGGQSQGFPAATDPCGTAAAVSTAAIRERCIATGVPAALVGTAGLRAYTQIQGLFGGNPNLSEEKSDSYTFGAVIRPTFIPRLNITVDYFNIKVEDAIATAGGGVANILATCYDVTANPSGALCQFIQRDPVSGEINGAGNNVVTATNANIAVLKTSGIDVQMDYSIPLNFGFSDNQSKLLLSFLGTWTEKDDTQPVAGLDTVKCAGYFGTTCGNPHPKYKWNARASWINGPLTTSVRWRHLSSVKDDAEGFFTVDRIKAFNYFDLAFSGDINDQFSMTAGVNNLLDKKPPVIGSNAEQSNTYPGTYDVLGRDFFVSANFRF